MAKQNRLIDKLSEGVLNSAEICMEIDGKVVRGCGCCLCAPNVLGAGDETAKQASRKIADDVMMVVVGAAIKP